MNHSKHGDESLLLPRLPQAAQENIISLLDSFKLDGRPREEMARCMASSRYLSQWAKSHPADFASLVAQDFAIDFTAQPATKSLEALEKQHGLDTALRLFRNRGMVCLTVRQCLQRDTPERTVRLLSQLADVLVAFALQCHWQRLVEERGQPHDSAGRPIQPMVFALGKLGGRELNFSSDVDLIAAHTASGESPSTSVDDMMDRLVKRLTASLAKPQVQGFVYRVDWRLRPFGTQGAPSASLAALDNYFETHARDWERYAWQKARCIAGDVETGENWLESLKPFIYRRYIDFGQIAGLRAMKDEIDRDVRLRGREQDVKRGWGGIRELEFTVQALQLVHGGARPSLQQRGFVESLQALQEEAVVDEEFAAQWLTQYWFMRRVENCWQAVDDAQTHVLPSDEEPRQRLLIALGYDDWGAFETELQQVRTKIRAHFLELFTPESDADLNPPLLELLTQLQAEEPEWPAPFAGLSVELESLKRAAGRRCSDAEIRLRTLELGVRLVDAAPNDETARRVLKIVEAICGRVNYVAMLEEHRDARRELVELCHRSRQIAIELERRPALLVELCQPESLYAPPSRGELRAHIDRQLAAADADDIEEQLEQLRRIRLATALRIAAADVSHVLPLMRVSDHLSELAEEIVRGALTVATQQMQQRWPDLGELPFAVVAYGKLGGLELSYSSDLDLVFLYDDVDVPGADLAPQVFYTRLVQKLINALATQTGAGRCYEVDMRLRPNGNAGLLVTSLAAFEKYQHESAWTWEHQALVRARPIAGDPRVMQQFTELRTGLLRSVRDVDKLRADVLEMRQKMRKELAPKNGEFNPKHSPGGMVDVEFFAQWLVLAQAPDHPGVEHFSDVLRILESAESTGVIAADTRQMLAERYIALRACVHAHALGSDEQMEELPEAPPCLAEFFAGTNA